MNLEEEKLLVDHKHKKDLYRMFIEKGIIVLIVVIVGFYCNSIIEQYKSDQITKHFILESRLSAIKELRNQFGTLQIYMHQLMFVVSPEDRNELLLNYQKSLYEFNKIVNKSETLFPEELSLQLSYHYIIQQAIIGGVPFNLNHWGFATDLFQNFDTLMRKILWSPPLTPTEKIKPPRFELVIWPLESIGVKSAQEYYFVNYSKWLSENRKVETYNK